MCIVLCTSSCEGLHGRPRPRSRHATHNSRVWLTLSPWRWKSSRQIDRVQTFLLRRCLREVVRRVFAPLGFREGSLMITKLLRGGRGRDLLGIALLEMRENEGTERL